MKHRRKKKCPECSTKLKIIRRNNETYVSCPKCRFEEKFKERVRTKDAREDESW